MNFPQFSSIGMPLPLTEGIPENYRGFLLTADTRFRNGEEGFMLVQQRKINDKWLRYYKMRPSQKMSASLANPQSDWLRLLINLGHSIKLHAPSGSPIQLLQNQFFLRRHTSGLETFQLKSGKEFELLEAWYTGNKTHAFEAAFPELKTAPSGPRWILPKDMETIREILANPYSPAAHQMYYDISLDNLLFRLLSNPAAVVDKQATNIEIEATHRAKKILVENIRHYPDVKLIADRVGLSAYKLKQLFRKVYHKNAFEIFLHAKMDKAYQLVTTTNESIKSIAIDTGFKWAMNFATAFRQHFGEAPETLREKMRHDKR